MISNPSPTEKIKSLQQIISDWAKSIPFPVRIKLFGSRLKGDTHTGSDLDLSLEFLDSPPENERILRWFDYHDDWQNELSSLISEDVHLSLFEGSESPKMERALSEGSYLIYETIDSD